MKGKDRLNLQLVAGRVKRYHTQPTIGEQSVAEHSYNVVNIVRWIAAGELSQNLLLAAIDHDVPEVITGDTPHTAKKQHTGMAHNLHEWEKKIQEAASLSYPNTHREQELLKWADLLEMGIWAVHQHSMGNQNALNILSNVVEAMHEDGGFSTNPRVVELFNELEDYLKERTRKGEKSK